MVAGLEARVKKLRMNEVMVGNLVGLIDDIYCNGDVDMYANGFVNSYFFCASTPSTDDDYKVSLIAIRAMT